MAWTRSEPSRLIPYDDEIFLRNGVDCEQDLGTFRAKNRLIYDTLRIGRERRRGCQSLQYGQFSLVWDSDSLHFKGTFRTTHFRCELSGRSSIGVSNRTLKILLVLQQRRSEHVPETPESAHCRTSQGFDGAGLIICESCESWWCCERCLCGSFRSEYGVFESTERGGDDDDTTKERRGWRWWYDDEHYDNS